jgi:hypothetical protein
VSIAKRRPFVPAAVALACALALGAACGRAPAHLGGAGGRLGTGLPGGDGGAGGGFAGGSGIGGGAGGSSAPPFTACAGASDPRLVIAPQRSVLLTSNELVNMVRALVGDEEANAIVAGKVFPVTSPQDWFFPPAWTPGENRVIPDQLTMQFYTALAQHVAQYVFDGFAAVTGCAAPATDDCATAYLGAFAEKAYRRPLDASEQADLQARYDAARAAGTVEQAAQQAIAAVLVATPFLYRSEQGDPTRASTSPPGVPLTPYELASALSFFLTDGPPDAPLLAAARAGTLTADTLGAEVDRLLATQAARDWLRTMMETYFFFNGLPRVLAFADTTKFPELDAQLLADMQTEARMFLDFTLWNLALPDLLTSRTTFINSTLANVIYGVPVPAGATTTTFTQTTLPVDQRAGLLTNAAFLTNRMHGDRESLVSRGQAVTSYILGEGIPGPPDNFVAPVEAALAMIPTETEQQEAAYRASIPLCATCHGETDPFGLTFDGYDAIARVRTVDRVGMPVDGHATLPPDMGGAKVANAIELSSLLAQSPLYLDTLAEAMLQYAMVDSSAPVELPTTMTAGCAVIGVVQTLRSGLTPTFSQLLRAVATSPAFTLRSPAN